MKTAPDNTYRRLFMNAFEEDINSSFAYLNNVNYTKKQCGNFKQNCIDSFKPYNIKNTVEKYINFYTSIL